MYRDEIIWCTQKAMAQLFDVGVPAISKHLNNIYAEGELQQDSTVSKMEIVQIEGAREIKRLSSHAGEITAEFAKSFAESEFEKYRIIQDRLFQSDFDRFNDTLLPLDID